MHICSIVPIMFFINVIYTHVHIHKKFLKILFICGKREREGEREGEKCRVGDVIQFPLLCSSLGTWPAPQACALTGNQTSDLSVCRLALNPWSHTSRGSKKIFNKKNI